MVTGSQQMTRYDVAGEERKGNYQQLVIVTEISCHYHQYEIDDAPDHQWPELQQQPRNECADAVQ